MVFYNSGCSPLNMEWSVLMFARLKHEFSQLTIEKKINLGGTNKPKVSLISNMDPCAKFQKVFKKIAKREEGGKGANRLYQ